MCLSRTLFTLDNNGEGVGYKAVPRELISKTKNGFKINASITNPLTYRPHKLSKQYEIAEYHSLVLRDDDDIYYRKGFHIFIDKKAAILYGKYSMIRKDCFYVIKVNYKDVLAFGYNYVNEHKSYPCVIANKMKVMEIINE